MHRMFACLFVYNMKYLPSLHSVWTNDRAIFLVQGSFVCPMGIKGNLDHGMWCFGHLLGYRCEILMSMFRVQDWQSLIDYESLHNYCD